MRFAILGGCVIIAKALGLSMNLATVFLLLLLFTMDVIEFLLVLKGLWK
jgi:hypothetical protein